MKKKVLLISLAVVMFLLALGITLYPLISSYYNNRHQSEIHTKYEERLEQIDNSAKIEAKQLAIAYNNALKPENQIGEAFTEQTLLEASVDYDSQLNIAGDGIMCYVEIPRIDVVLPVYHGTDATTLERGVGHLLGSSLPVGGESTHSVLTAHSGVASMKLFSDLDQLQSGDVFYIHVLGEVLSYQVYDINTFLPHKTELLQIQTGKDLSTLVTSTPFAVNTHRLLVTGERIAYEEAEEIVEEQQIHEKPAQSTWEKQYLQGVWIGIGAAVILGLTVLAVWLIRRRRHG